MRDRDKLFTGADIVNINRINKILIEKKDSFYNKIFTENEKKYISKGGDKATTIGGIFAAKEATSKTLGTGISTVGWKDIEILHDERGKPYINLVGNGKLRMDELGIDNMDLSISHEEEYAIAFVVAYSHYPNINIDDSIKRLLPKRKKESHKGTYGKVGIIAGSKGMTGAAYLASQSALRTGSGLVYTIIPQAIETIMSIKLTEAIIKPVRDNNGYLSKDSLDGILNEIEEMDVIAIGPGIGVDKEKMQIIEKILKTYPNPIVIDADGINSLSFDLNILNNHISPIIITPHPKELARLLSKSTREVQENRIYYSKYISSKYNIIVVLKGFNTIVALPTGDIYINETGNPGMATAGSGDILTGIIASFIGQGIKPEDAAKLGVFCHGLAGDLASYEKGEYGVMATDILENIPYSIKKILG
jgi:NAD(P)H-hydrate epimerase